MHGGTGTVASPPPVDDLLLLDLDAPAVNATTMTSSNVLNAPVPTTMTMTTTTTFHDPLLSELLNDQSPAVAASATAESEPIAVVNVSTAEEEHLHPDQHRLPYNHDQHPKDADDVQQLQQTLMDGKPTQVFSCSNPRT
jgi:hypothetical protein